MDYSWGLLGEWLGIKRTVADNELRKHEKVVVVGFFCGSRNVLPPRT
jgi:hypothetical protein